MPTETWKLVSDPYYTNGDARVDYEMANPLPERSAKYPVYRYSYRGVVFSALFPAGAIAGGHSMDYDNSMGHVDIASSWIDKNVREITIKLRKEDVDTGTKTYIDEVTRVIPEKEPPCTCTAWVNAECTSPGKRRQTRTCTPAGCDIEERIIDDPTCVPSTKTVTFGSVPADATVTVD